MTTATQSLHTYYFHNTHETVVARNAMLAAAFYATHHELTHWTFELTHDDYDGPVAFITANWGDKIEICLEDRALAPEGTISKIQHGHAVPPLFFTNLMYESANDWAYEPGDEVTNMHDDILQPLKDDFHCLTPEQLQQLAHAIVQRRHDYGDILPTLEYIIHHHYGRYMEHMHEIIYERTWDFEEQLDDLLRPALHTGGCC